MCSTAGPNCSSTGPTNGSSSSSSSNRQRQRTNIIRPHFRPWTGEVVSECAAVQGRVAAAPAQPMALQTADMVGWKPLNVSSREGQRYSRTTPTECITIHMCCNEHQAAPPTRGAAPWSTLVHCCCRLPTPGSLCLLRTAHLANTAHITNAHMPTKPPQVHCISVHTH
jgi:hypothetical protein